MEQLPQPPSPESGPQLLRYPEGWREIMEAPDALDYQTWMRDLTDLTQQRLREIGATDAEDERAIITLWQQAIELVADAAIDPEDLGGMSQAEIVETGLLTLQANLEGIGWDEEGLAFTVPNMFTGEEASVDLRQLPGTPPNN
jgi:hypothetical protein